MHDRDDGRKGFCTMTKEHGILMSGPMVLAMLAKRKRVTRRMSKQWLKVKAGDQLWVREAFCYAGVERADGHDRVAYRATEGSDADCWKPSIHMPRWASRITVIATEDARLERLWDITEADAIAEGVERVISDSNDIVYRDYGGERGRCLAFASDSFQSLWSTLHTKPGERYEDNPEVVRIGRFEYV